MDFHRAERSKTLVEMVHTTGLSRLQFDEAEYVFPRIDVLERHSLPINLI